MLKDLGKNPLVRTDGYNLSHEYLKCNTDWEISHMYNRKKGMILYGFNEIVNKLLQVTIEPWMIDEAEADAISQGVTFPRELFQRIIDECDGDIPIMVEALPEGTWCPKGTPFAQIRNTVEGFGELVTWWEGVLMKAFFPSACATRALEIRRYLEAKCKAGGYTWDSFRWRIHSFGYRGHRSEEDAYWAGTAWSMFISGTDDFHIVSHLRGSGLETGTIPALAHKVTQQFDAEMECFKHAIDATAVKGGRIVALVIDTYDAWNVIESYVPSIAKYAETKGIRVVFRPDSGDVKEQVAAIHDIVVAYELTNVGCIIGDSLTFPQIIEADIWFTEENIPLDFVNYGLGAGFYNDITRDYLGWAMKTCYSNGKARMKLVKGTPEKQSIPGEVYLQYDDGNQMVVHATGSIEDIEDGGTDELYGVAYCCSVVAPGVTIRTVPSDVDYGGISALALAQDTSQESIILSPVIHDLVKVFMEEYLD